MKSDERDTAIKVPPGAVQTVHEWAEKRANKSMQPGYFRHQFHDELTAILGGVDLLENRWELHDPIQVAAEIEALGASRILAQWDRRHELTILRPKRYR